MNKWLNLIALLFATASVVAAGVEQVIEDEEELSEARQEEYYNLYGKTSGDHRNLQVPSGTFETSYAIVIEDQNIDIIAPNPLFAFGDLVNKRPGMLNGRSPIHMVGMKTMTKGVVLDPMAVKLEEQITTNVLNSNLFAGGVQPINTRPIGNDAFFMTGACTVTAEGDDGQYKEEDEFFTYSQIFLPSITAQQCHYDLCLGDRGYSCVNFYGGGGYLFNPYDRISMGDDAESIITNNNMEPQLPPPFDMTILGGTGAYRLIKGTATLTTSAGQTRGSIEKDIARRGSIVQILQIKSNIPLRAAPRTDGGSSTTTIESGEATDDDAA